MKVKRIKTEKDYDTALKTIERLWGSPRSSPQGDVLEVLVTLVEVYERKRYPSDIPDPLDAIRFRL